MVREDSHKCSYDNDNENENLKYFIYLQYDGTQYHGWQTQPDAVTVQETIEEKLSMLLRRETFIVGAGRTDAGVHARLMVAHFAIVDHKTAENDESGQYEPIGLTLEEIGMNCQDLAFKLNQVLPHDIKILKIVPVKDEAHARFSPLSRTYRYYITTDKPLYNRDYVMRTYEPLDIEAMNHACAKLFCYEDFTSFSKLHTDVKTNNCKIMEAYWTKETNAEGSGESYVFMIKADRFLRNMVRAIVGTLIKVGRHRMTIQEFAQVIERKDRCTAGDSVPAAGLFLEDIEYPEEIFLESDL